MTQLERSLQIAIITPYLSRAVLQTWSKEEKEQRKRFGLDEQIGDLKALTPEEIPVTVSIIGETPLPLEAPDLVIAGSTVPQEMFVSRLRGSGIIVARYSIFYGGPSDYTGLSPAQGGYALDIPKSVDAVRALLSSTQTLSAIRSHDAAAIKVALKDISEELPEPILTTPYLDEILRVQ